MKENKLLLSLHKLRALGKLFIALIAAAIVVVLIVNDAGSIQVMSAWVCFSLVEMALSWTIMLTAHPKQIVHIAKNQDNSRLLILIIILVASFVSLVTIVLMLRSLPDPGEKGYYFHVFLSFAAVACS